MKAKPFYWTDLRDEQWQILEPLLPKGGRPPKYPRRAMVNALLYQARAGCSWRLLPENFPPWNSVWELFSRWRDQGVIAKVHAALRDECRRRAGRHGAPSAAILDSQSVKTTEKGGRAALTRAKRSRAASATCS